MVGNYKESLAEPIFQNFSILEEEIMSDIIRRIRKMGEITSTADYQINLLQILGNSTEDIEHMLQNTLDASYPEIFELYDKVLEKEYTRNRDIYEQVNAFFLPYKDNEQLKQLTEGLIRQSQNELSNITRSLGFYLNYGGGKLVYTPLAEIYQGYLDNAMNGIISGAFDYNTMLRKTIRQLTNSGLRTIDYASGYCSRVSVAVRKSIMTGISQLTGKISDMDAEKLGTEYFEVAWHANARPSHQVWQGKVWSKEQLVSVCGLGSVTGLLGANCYHEYYPFFPGLSERNWTDEWLKEQNRKEAEVKMFKGKGYSAYEATQKQRNMETAMRAQRQRVRLMQEGKADPGDVMLAKAKYQAQLNEYAAFSKKMGIPQQRERIYLDLKGRVAPNMFTKYAGSGIIKEKKMYRKKSTKTVEPMPKKQLQKITKSFKRNGGIIQMNDATDAYLKLKNAEAITYNSKTILLHQHPSRSAVYEELIHATQYRQGKNDGSLKARLLCEIEAQEKLLKYQKPYKLTKEEVLQTEKALKAYQKELSKLLKGGR